MTAPVEVSPSSALQQSTDTYAGGGIASQSFYFGGNPNTAAALNNKWLWAGLALAALAAVLLFRRGLR
jgi:LPXTG-motif cell wall-anchored protein